MRKPKRIFLVEASILRRFQLTWTKTTIMVETSRQDGKPLTAAIWRGAVRQLKPQIGESVKVLSFEEVAVDRYPMDEEVAF